MPENEDIIRVLSCLCKIFCTISHIFLTTIFTARTLQNPEKIHTFFYLLRCAG